MGIKKKEASLTYSTQQLNGDELNKVKDANMINSLAGKSEMCIRDRHKVNLPDWLLSATDF